MEEKFVVYEINEDELNEVAGGDKLPYIGPVICGKCTNQASKHGFVIRNNKGSILKVHFSKPLCDGCAQKEVDLYAGFEFVTWL